MSGKRLISLCVAAAGAAVLLCCAHGRSLPSIPPPLPLGHTSPEAYTGPGAYTEIACSEAVLAGARMYYAEELMVYKTTKRRPTREEVLRIAQQLRSEAGPEAHAQLSEPQGDWRYGMLGRWQIELYDDGTCRLLNRDADAIVNETGRRISDSRVRAIADGFLRRTGLLPAGARFSGVTPGTSHSVTLADGRSREVVHEFRARYTRYLEGLACGDLYVEVRADGRLRGYWARVPEAKPAGRYPIITPEEALASFRAGDVEMMGPGGRIPERGRQWYRAEVESIHIAYTGVAPYTATVSYRHPMYLIRARVFDQRGRLHPDRLTGSVPAVKQEYLDEKLLYRSEEGT